MDDEAISTRYHQLPKKHNLKYNHLGCIEIAIEGITDVSMVVVK